MPFLRLPLLVLGSVLAISGEGAGSEGPSPAVPAASESAATDLPRPAPAAGMLIPARTIVVLELLQPISTRTAKPGDRFELRVAQPVLISGQTVIPTGSAAIGEVIHAQKGGVFGKAGELLLTVRHVEVNGQRIPMRLFQPAHGKDQTGTAIATWIAVGVFAAFVRGGQIELPADTAISATVAKDTTIFSPAPTLTTPIEPGASQ